MGPLLGPFLLAFLLHCHLQNNHILDIILEINYSKGENMKFLILLGFAMSMFASCDKLSGSMNLEQDLHLVKRNKPYIIPAGQYKASMKINSRKKATFKLEGADKYKVKVQLPARDFPTRNGDIHISNTEIDQPYDLHGRVNTTVTRSEERRGYESCTYEERYTRCTVDSDGNRRCHTAYRTIRGNRFVRYYVKTENKRLEMKFHEPGRSEPAAAFTGRSSNAERIYQSVGTCR